MTQAENNFVYRTHLERYVGKKAFAGCAKSFVLQSKNPKWQDYAKKENLEFELITP